MAEFDLLDALSGMSKTDLGEVIDKGVYPMRCIRCDYGQSSKKGTPGWTYVAEITEGEYQGETLEGTAWWSKTKGGTQLFWQQMQALGVTLEWMQATKPSNDEIAESMVNALFMGSVDIEEPQAGSQGRRRNRLIAASAIGGAEEDSTPMADSTEDEGGDVLVDGPFADAAPEGPTGDLDDPALPNPDGSAGEESTPLAETAADPQPEVTAPAEDPDDPWGP